MDTAAPGSPELAEARATGEARPASREGEAAAEEEDVSLADASGTVGIPDVFLEHLHGTWKNTTTQGIEGYLKHLGVAWAKRKIAASFKPETSWAVVDGTLQSLMPSPLGDRLERFPTNVEAFDSDLDGNEFVKTSAFTDGQLVTTAVRRNAPSKPPFITRRWITPTGQLTQVNEHEGVSMTRVFTKLRSS
uniref:Cytosolic fatty-acid binding proteins domain-containing protein n=1 Tax=Haptolina ericina TaxID=156174 RepID=A0A7S3EUA4_9EUKA|mmetsp:Transcript_19251/g.43064  ORF Transcript_19251/g.43064 Transcript_19251/m.43064 type:complete len:191 (+) Transcript_19251:1-573(+)